VQFSGAGLTTKAILRSTIDGTSWCLQSTTSISATLVAVKDSDARQSPQINPTFRATG